MIEDRFLRCGDVPRASHPTLRGGAKSALLSASGTATKSKVGIALHSKVAPVRGFTPSESFRTVQVVALSGDLAGRDVESL